MDIRMDMSVISDRWGTSDAMWKVRRQARAQYAQQGSEFQIAYASYYAYIIRCVL